MGANGDWANLVIARESRRDVSPYNFGGLGIDVWVIYFRAGTPGRLTGIVQIN